MLRYPTAGTGHFNPRPPWGGRPGGRSGRDIKRPFQSTPSVGRATAKLFVIDFDSIAISIHALRGEGDEHPKKTYAQDFFISIHALRGEGDFSGLAIDRRAVYFNPRPPWGGRRESVDLFDKLEIFQSTPSVGRATATDFKLLIVSAISIHALRGEGDCFPRCNQLLGTHFNPRPPWGGRQSSTMIQKILTYISIHALRGEGDVSAQT